MPTLQNSGHTVLCTVLISLRHISSLSLLCRHQRAVPCLKNIRGGVSCFALGLLCLICRGKVQYTSCPKYQLRRLISLLSLFSANISKHKDSSILKIRMSTHECSVPGLSLAQIRGRRRLCLQSPGSSFMFCSGVLFLSIPEEDLGCFLLLWTTQISSPSRIQNHKQVTACLKNVR